MKAISSLDDRTLESHKRLCVVKSPLQEFADQFKRIPWWRRAWTWLCARLWLWRESPWTKGRIYRFGRLPRYKGVRIRNKTFRYPWRKREGQWTLNGPFRAISERNHLRTR